jgi:hypothetical protein
MDDEIYLYPVSGAVWTISRWVEDRWIALIQDRSLFEEGDAAAILRALGIPAHVEELDRYFPVREGCGRCPTFELLELCDMLDPTNPRAKKAKGECGV